MRFEALLERAERKELSQAKAAEPPGMNVRTFRHGHDRIAGRQRNNAIARASK